MKKQWDRETDKSYNSYQCLLLASYCKHGHSEIDFVANVAAKYQLKHQLKRVA